MPLAEFLEDPRPAPSVKVAPQPADSAVKMRKKVFLEFGAIIALGLALAGWYVGYRVLAARAGQPPAPAPAAATTPPIVVHTPVPAAPAKLAPPPTPAVVESKPADVPAVRAPAATTATPKAATPEIVQAVKAPQLARRKDAAVQPFKRRDANPRAGERYLQIAAFGPRALDGFLKTLEGQGLHPVVAPGPLDNIYRILVGPFSNAASLEETRGLIKACGIEPMLRVY
ncbi:MAG: SPOR domain-containing protein [Bryobacteraceae bacterium]|jgi:sporulation related protein